MADQDSARDLSKHQADYPRIISSLLKLGLPITIIATIIVILLGQGNHEDSSLRINIPKMLGNTTSVLMDSRNIGVPEDAGWLSNSSALFSDGSILDTNGYNLADGGVDLEGLPRFYSTEQIDDTKALIWSYSPDDKQFKLWMFTKGKTFPEYTLEPVRPLENVLVNGRMDYLEQDGARNLLFEGNVNRQGGVYMFNIDSGEYTLLETDRPVIGYAVNAIGDMYYFSKKNDTDITTLVYGTIQNGKFNEVRRKTIDLNNYANNILSHGIEVANDGTLTYLYNNIGTTRNPTLEDIQIIKIGRDLVENDGATLDKFNINHEDMGHDMPFITST